MQNGWRNELKNVTVPDKIKSWLLTDKAISISLKRISNNFRLELLSQNFTVPIADEAKILNNRLNDSSLLRRVLLLSDNNKCSIGRTIIPRATYECLKHDFDTLGSKLLGENLLYKNPNTKRGNFSYKCITKHDPLWSDIDSVIKEPAECYWARRSIFTISKCNLLLTEIFLPTIPDYPVVV